MPSSPLVLKNGSKSRLCVAALMPSPSSLTAISTQSASTSRVETSIVPCDVVAWTAFRMRLTRTWSSR